MKEKTFFGMLALSIVLVVVSALMKVEHVKNANYALAGAMAFQASTIAYFIGKNLIGKRKMF
ncbi:MAG: hypothetical protein EOO50_01690 [Flavobacterium sp.]|uniref:hypothetical protein n=1 Tax=Flavobacterium sp. TaxID=239 RepID=UPI001205DEA8|nr:hypothetical protein [Flavobacterium sp.]RZJ68530.1 MAG: hypothetical protein EOO50_01690 [Flavobacterium sp.]